MKNVKLCAFADEADETLIGQIKALNKNKINYIEIRGIDGTNISAMNEEQVRKVKSMLDESGIKVWSIGSPVGKSNIKDDFSKETEKFEKILKFAEILGAENIRIFSFYGTDGKAEYKKEVIKRLRIFAEMSSKRGITLCHENEKGIYGDIPERCAEIHKEISEIKSVFDPANFVQCGIDTVSAWKTLKKYVKYCHIKDSKENGEIVPSGYGIGNIAYIVDDYVLSGGKFLTLEPHLYAFVGLQGLENKESGESVVGNLHFKTAQDAFDAGANSLRKIIKELGIGEE